jgi:hypothetical protein
MIGDDPGNYVHEEGGRRVPATQFDYDAVDERVFNFREQCDLSEFSQEEVDKAIEVLRKLLAWIWQNGMKNADGVKIRAIIVCWIFLKELRPMTLTQMATGFGMKKQSLGRWVDQFKEVFKIRTPHMRTLGSGPGRGHLDE